MKHGPTQDPSDIVKYLCAMKEADQAGKAAGSSDVTWGKNDAFSDGGRTIEGFNVRNVFIYAAEGSSMTYGDVKAGKISMDTICAISFMYRCTGGKSPSGMKVLWVRPGHEDLLTQPHLEHDIRLFELTYYGGERVTEN